MVGFFSAYLWLIKGTGHETFISGFFQICKCNMIVNPIFCKTWAFYGVRMCACVYIYIYLCIYVSICIMLP